MITCILVQDKKKITSTVINTVDKKKQKSSSTHS